MSDAQIHLPSAASAGLGVRFVLVRTSHPGNIGAAARAIRTMGFSRLVLVAPHKFPHADATAIDRKSVV